MTIKTKYKLIEVKSTSDLKEATDYINEWDPYNKQEILDYLNNNFKPNPEGLKYAYQENINLILYRIDYYSSIQNSLVSEANFAVCNDEKTMYPKFTLF